MSEVREAAYNTLVRQQLKYAKPFGTPLLKWKLNKLRRSIGGLLAGLPVTTCNFDRMASVSAMLETSGWRTLEQKRADSRLCLFYKIVNNMVAVPLPDYIKPTPHRQYVPSRPFWHSSKFTQGRTFINILFSTGSRSVECPPRQRCQLAKPSHIQGWNWQVAARQALRSQV